MGGAGDSEKTGQVVWNKTGWMLDNQGYLATTVSSREQICKLQVLHLLLDSHPLVIGAHNLEFVAISSGLLSLRVVSDIAVRALSDILYLMFILRFDR